MKKLLLLASILVLTACCNSETSSFSPLPPVQNSLQGLTCNVYNILQSDEQGTVNWSEMFSDGILKFTSNIANFNIANESSNNIFASFSGSQQALIGYTDYAINCTGILTVPVAGNYVIQVGSDDGSQLLIDNNVILNMPDLQSFASSTSDTLPLTLGSHSIQVLYFQGPATNIGLQVSWQGPSPDSLNQMVIVPTTALSH